MELNRAPSFASDDAEDDGAASRKNIQVDRGGATLHGSEHRPLDTPAVVAISAQEWADQLADLAPKLMCLSGTDAYKFSRDKLLKKQWQHPAHKKLVAVGKGFISWTGRKPVRYISANSGPSEALDDLMCACSRNLVISPVSLSPQRRHGYWNPEKRGNRRCQALHLSRANRK